MASYAVGTIVDYRTSEGPWHEAVVLVDNTGDNVDLKVRHPNGSEWENKAAVALGTAVGKFRVRA